MEIKGILNKYLKQLEDNSIIFTGNKLVIHIPEKFIENGITQGPVQGLSFGPRPPGAQG